METQTLAEKKPHGGSRSGAGRPRVRDLNDLGRWIEASGKTKEEISETLGISVSLLGQYSRGSATPSLKVAVKIEELTNGTIDCKFWVKSDT